MDAQVMQIHSYQARVIELDAERLKALLKFIVDAYWVDENIGIEMKISSIKALRAITGLGLRESKILVEAEITDRMPPYGLDAAIRQVLGES